MIYKPSSCNYFTLNEKELLIVNFLKGISSFRVVTGNDVDLVKNYLSISLLDIKNPNALEKMLIDNGFLIPENYDEDSEIEMLQLDYIYNSKLRIVVHVTKDCNFRCKYCFIDFENKKMDLLIQDKIIDYIRMNISKYSGVYISWFGGEPLLGMDVIPDAVILCVNSFDEVDYIRRTIQYIESCVDTKVIALSVFPLGYNDQLGRSRLVPLSDEVLDKVATALYKQLGIPAFILGRESDMEELYAKTVSFFSSDSETKE